MNYATQYPVRNNQRSLRQKTKATAPPVIGVRTVDGKTQRCRRDTEGQAKVSTDQQSANDFLKSRFLPKISGQANRPPEIKTDKVVRDFYKSLTQLAGHYSINLMPTAEFGYPYNIALALSDVKAKLKDHVANWNAIQVVQKNTKTYLICEERFVTGTTLYFVPVIPLFLMVKDKHKRRAGALLLSVCAYLYHMAEIPYYRQEYTTLFWQYEMHAEWIEQEDETNETFSYRNDLQHAEWIGDVMEQKLINPKNLVVFEHRISHFTGKDGFEKKCLQVAEKAYELYKHYPDEKFFRNANAHNWQDEDFDNDSILSIEKYISFSARNDGWLSDSIVSSLNEEFGNYGETEEPTISKYFNGKAITTASLDFENKLFALLDDLAYLLNTYQFQDHG
ncbi:hypothetical protein [Pedobacter alluvionis]|nr:hypothetical protein [Pedobacter alluvionis]TFB30264.1 hypothetical protein E3V97_19030 [Pedobacter alluvionis]